MPSVLLIEDAKEFQLLVSNALAHMCDLSYAVTAAEAKTALEEKEFDLIILDIGLPDKSGYELCSELRADKNLQEIPIIILTSKSTISDKLTGFSLGADDYIVKPFDVLELQARATVRLKRSAQLKAKQLVLEGNGLRMDLSSHEVTVEGMPGAKVARLDLTPHEYKILQLLMSNKDKVFSREHLLNKIWGYDVHIEDRTVDKHISSLRKKLGDKGNLIHTVTGTGYKFSERVSPN